MSENALWQTMRRQMGANKYWREATRHEDALQAGIADVSFVTAGGKHGWMELKQIDEYPRRGTTIVAIPHFTNEQKIWLRKKGKAGGDTWMFMKIARDYYLFHWAMLRDVGKVDAPQLKRLAAIVWVGHMHWDELGRFLDSHG